jgi:lysophospholipase L1-like esterase
MVKVPMLTLILLNQSVAVQCDISTFQNNNHHHYEETVKEMKTTIEVLEEYISSLKNELIDKSNCWAYPKMTARIGSRSKSQCRPSSFSIQTQNRYDLLQTYDHNTTHVILNEQSKNDMKEQNIHKYFHSNHKVIKRANLENKMTQSPLKKVKRKGTYKCINLYADSHGRGIAELLRTNITNSITESIIKPNATLNDVIPQKKRVDDEVNKKNNIFNPNEYTLIIAGTNDVDRGQGNKIYQTFKNFITDNKNNKHIITTLLTRHDLPHYHQINIDSAKINSSLLELNDEGKVGVIDVSLMKRNCFTVHGLHLNGKGKHKLSEMIVAKIQEMESTSSNSTFEHSKLRCREQIKTYAKALQPTDQYKDQPEEDAIPPEHHHRRRSLPTSLRGPRKSFLLLTENRVYKKR